MDDAVRVAVRQGIASLNQQVHGAGTQTLNWDVKDGNWSVVVMNADGSKGVNTRVSAGASLPWLDELELAAWISAALLGVLGGTLLAGGLGRGTMR